MITPEIQRFLRCPRCKAELQLTEERFVCQRPACARAYPIVRGTPVLINEDSSLFSIADYVQGQETTHKRTSPIKRFLRRHLPDLGRTPASERNYQRLLELLLQSARRPRVLVIGGGLLGKGMDALAHYPDLALVETDVALTDRSALICDAHDLPFADASFDGAIAQAVLEHVLDPYRCVAELHRVLKSDGLVYAETPFMQQVHGGRYDFTRFTPLGHRRLFREFTEVAGGASGGPGSVLAWSYLYFLRGFTSTRRTRAAVTVFARLTGFWLKYFDRLFAGRAGAQDGAWGAFFLGRKSTRALPDRELVKLYRGIS